MMKDEKKKPQRFEQNNKKKKGFDPTTATEIKIDSTAEYFFCFVFFGE